MLSDSANIYVLDDSFKVSETIERMSDEEREQQAKIWEEEGRREKEKIKKRKKLAVING